MAVKVAINGFGRIGRLVFRALVEQGLLGSTFDVVAVGDIVPADNLAYLLKYDSTQGRFQGTVDSKKSAAGQDRATTCSSSTATKSRSCQRQDARPNCRGTALGVQLVIESTGLFTDAEKAKGHLAAGAKKVIISAPAKGEDITIVMGVNDDKYDLSQAQHHFQRLLHDELPRAARPCPAQGGLRHRGGPDDDHPLLHRDAEDGGRPLEEGLEGRPHRGASTSSRPRPAPPRRSRSCCPEVKGKLTGMSFRVPTPTVSVVDLTVQDGQGHLATRRSSAAMKRASETYLKGILGYTEDEVVSSDFIHDKLSSIFDAGSRHRAEQATSSSSSPGTTTSGAIRNRVVDLTKKIAAGL